MSFGYGTTTERLFNTAGAAEYLGRHIKDGRNYVHVLIDQRRGRRSSCIPYCRRGKQAYYRENDLLLFIDAERKRGVAVRPSVLREEDDPDGIRVYVLEESLNDLMALRDAASDEIERINALLEAEKEAA